MRFIFGCSTLPFIWAFTVAGCSTLAATQDEPGTPGEPGEPDEPDETERVISTGGPTDDASTYFEITADRRRCASPICGGWFLTRLNRSTTTCHDGRDAATCYTPVLDWSEAGLSNAKQARLLDAAEADASSRGVLAIVRGAFAPTNHTTPRPTLGRFVVSEAWVAENHAVSGGTFVKVKDNGVRCIAAPCPSVGEQTLNALPHVDIAGIDWAPAGFTDRQIEECRQAILSPEGLLVAGDRYTIHENGRTEPGRTSTAAYLRLGGAGR